MSNGEKFVPQMQTSSDRRAPVDEGERYTDKMWHRSKAVSLANVFGFCVIMFGLVATYYEQRASIKDLNTSNLVLLTEMGSEHEGRMLSLEDAMKERQEDSIHASTVLAMFDSRDKEIANLAMRMEAMEIRQAKTNELLTSILMLMPKNP